MTSITSVYQEKSAEREIGTWCVVSLTGISAIPHVPKKSVLYCTDEQ